MSSCQHVFLMGIHKGEYCGNPIVTGEKFCKVCILKRNNRDQMSSYFREMYDKLNFYFLNSKSKLISKTYNYKLFHDGRFHLRGIAVTDYMGDYTGEIREATVEEKREASDLGIVID